MNVVEFEDWLDRLGEDVSRWPEPQREAAGALLDSSPEARTLLQEALALRQALAAPKLRAPAGLADRIVAQATRSNPPPEPPQRVSLPARVLRFLLQAHRPAVALSLCFLVGVLVGVFNRWKEAEADQVDLPTYVAYVVDMARNAD
jgi:hypothetical protein